MKVMGALVMAPTLRNPAGRNGFGRSPSGKAIERGTGPVKNESMDITYRGQAVQTVGTLPEVGAQAPDFTLVGSDLSDITKADFAGRRVVLNIFPSIDTGVCATAARKFNQIADELPNTTVICVSKDLPFALNRFCGAEGIDNVVTASAFRSSFGEDYGVTMENGPIATLLSRSVVVLDADGTVVYTEQVPEISQEPDYEAARKAVSAA